MAENKRGLANMLEKSYYQEGALVPAIPWSSTSRPSKPNISVRMEGNTMLLDWKAGDGPTPTHWVVQTRSNGKWAPTKIVASYKRGMRFEINSKNPAPEVISVTAGNRYGNVSSPAVVQRR